MDNIRTDKPSWKHGGYIFFRISSKHLYDEKEVNNMEKQYYVVIRNYVFYTDYGDGIERYHSHDTNVVGIYDNMSDVRTAFDKAIRQAVLLIGADNIESESLTSIWYITPEKKKACMEMTYGTCYGINPTDI